jgi:hypothetical protein
MNSFTEITDSFLHKATTLEAIFISGLIVILASALSIALFIEYQHLC